MAHFSNNLQNAKAVLLFNLGQQSKNNITPLGCAIVTATLPWVLHVPGSCTKLPVNWMFSTHQYDQSWELLRVVRTLLVDASGVTMLLTTSDACIINAPHEDKPVLLVT